jgi:2-hydroxyacyl-CoA lyase 1
MPELNGGQVVARQLKAAGIDTAFGVVAGPMIEVMAGMQEAGIKVVNCRHELNACFMASAWGYINKKPGVVVAGSGPAVTNTVTGLHVATDSGMPLVVLGGSVHGRNRGWGGFQELDQVAFTKPACKWTATVDSTERIPEYVHIGLGKAVSGRPGGVYIDFPGNFIGRRVDEDRIQYRNASLIQSLPHPDPVAIETLAGMLAQAERPLILVGKGAAWADAGPALTELVNRGIPYVASPMGRGVIPDDNPMCMNAARSTALSGADMVLMVGGRFNWIFQFGRAPRFAENVRIAQVDIEAEEFASSANVELGITADCGIAVAQLNDALAGHTLRSASSGWSDQLREACVKNESTIAEAMASDEQPINHYRLLRDVRDAVTRETALSVDGELTMGVARAVLPAYNARLMLNSGTTGCMGTGLPYAMGAKLARPEFPSVAVLGDYAFGAAAMEVETAIRCNIAAVFVVSNNAGIAGHSIQDRLFGPDAPPIAALLPVDYERMAEMVGGFARRVTDPADIQPAIRDAIQANTLAVINVLTDPKGARRGSAYLG